MKDIINCTVKELLGGGTGDREIAIKILVGSLVSDVAKEKKIKNKSSYETDQIIFDTRVDAESVLTDLLELLSKYDWVSVADFKDISGISSSFTDNKYGWTDLHRTSIRRIRNGYVIDFPQPIDLNKEPANPIKTDYKKLDAHKKSIVSGFKSRDEAYKVLNQLITLISKFEVASVADLYDILGISSQFTDNKFGWDNLTEAFIAHGSKRYSYILHLPKTIVLS